ncbi:NAD(P)-dependent dehydrogenase (short-subunit alcohol dehydrogenase family) [Erwinia toletana]|uniref:NAD(P)-dependent dehydrogenase (Short-subunit alcohol dehydrogenase family) n=1 Tax=Winslowiella toletana TaxID=92490 RepID=A0ABS4PAF4_9GAMM|nr:SDR family oxidoreductase [Winslowiella toletana]MBP2169622.1 NAD(P)-dependent dehydrogenase (short-subunit alcohol dehydrogenase family) [Winslowiella toletana]
MSRTWFITGTSSGFGREMTETLLARGDRVAATLRNPAQLDDLQQRYGTALWVAPLDVTDTPAVHAVINRAFDQLGRIDVIVSNAGYGLGGAAEELSDEQIVQQINTNVIGSIQVTRAVLPHLRRQGGGRILQISSMGGQIVFPGLSLYHTTKWAIEGFIEAVREEVRGFNIEFTLIEPGTANTGFRDRGLVMAAAMAEYDGTPGHLLSQPFPWIGDAKKMVREMIASVDRSPAPHRLALGSDAYNLIKAALEQRLADLEADKAITLSTDLDEV